MEHITLQEANNAKRTAQLRAPGTLDFHMSAIFAEWDERDHVQRYTAMRNQWGLVAAHLKEAWTPQDTHAVNWLLSEAYKMLQESDQERARDWVSYAEQHAPARVTAYS